MDVLFYYKNQLVYRDDPIVDREQVIPRKGESVVFKNIKTDEIEELMVSSVIYHFIDEQIGIVLCKPIEYYRNGGQ
jgi:hypothetical protein